MLTVIVQWTSGGIEKLTLENFEALSEWAKAHHGEYSGFWVSVTNGGEKA